MKQRKKEPMVEFRVKMVTADGQLVQNRLADASFYYWRNRLDDSFIKLSLTCDCREKGCRFVSYTADPKLGITAIVEWLK